MCMQGTGVDTAIHSIAAPTGPVYTERRPNLRQSVAGRVGALGQLRKPDGGVHLRARE